MTSSTIENLYLEFSGTYINDPDFVIGFYEKNAIIFNNIKQFKDKEELEIYIKVISEYINAIYKKGRYNVTIDLADRHQGFIDKEIERLNADEIKNGWYYSISHFKGMASYELKDYKTATPIFKKLVLIDNQNENYKKWLDYSKYGQRRWLTYTILIFAFLLFVILVFFREYISYKARMSLNVIGLLLAFFVIFYDYYTKRSFRKKQKNIS